MSVMESLTLLLEKEKWSKDVKVKPGKMHKLLNVPENKKITDVYSSGKKLAKDLLNAVDGNKKKAIGMLNFAANIDPVNNVLDTARNFLKTIEEK